MANRLKDLAVACIVLLVLLVTGVVSARAQTAPPPPAAGIARRPIARLLASPYRPLVLQLRGAKLTPDQRQQVLGIFKTHRPELKSVQEKVRAARAAWQQAGTIDIEQRKRLNQERMAVLQAARTEIVNLLTPEQKARIDARRGRWQPR